MAAEKDKRVRLGTFLKELFDAACEDDPTLTQQRLARDLPSTHAPPVTNKVISTWMTGEVAPSKSNLLAYKTLIELLRAKAPGVGPSPQSWDIVIKQAMEESGRNRGGRQSHTSAPHRHSHIAAKFSPPELTGRVQELAELSTFATTSSWAEPDYLWLQAEPWAGKSALLASFALDPPERVDIVSYFVSKRWNTSRREPFLRTVTAQLAEIAEVRRPASADMEDALPSLYIKAAQASSERRRTLLLVIDGLDEDEDVSPNTHSIAALLPERPPPGLRIIVGGRPHPPVPTDLTDDHPLVSDPRIIRALTPSPDAQVIRAAAIRELWALLHDPLGSRLVGVLATAKGGLGVDDLAAVLNTEPVNIETLLLFHVTGRSMMPNDPTSGTYVLAHDELRETVLHQLGGAKMAQCQELLHDWATSYRGRDWHEPRPQYLQAGYLQLLEESRDFAGLTAHVLDPHRQRYLVFTARASLALAELDLVVRSVEEIDGSADALDVLARVAVSREFLLRYTETVPRELLRACARLGEVGRARGLALVGGRAASKAVRLADVARELAGMEHPEAAGVAREAAEWARQGGRQSLLEGPADGEDDGAAVAGAVVALLETGQRDIALKFLCEADKKGLVTHTALAEAAPLLRRREPAVAERMLTSLEERAEFLADGGPAEWAVAIDVWAAAAANADPGRAQRLYGRVNEFCRELWAEENGLDTVDVLAVAASALAKERPLEAGKLAGLALERLAAAFRDPGRLSPADLAHVRLGLSGTLARVVRALGDTEGWTARVGALVEGVPEAFRIGYSGEDVRYAARELRAKSGREIPGDADAVLRLVAAGDERRARQLLEDALGQYSVPGSRTAVPWLPELAGALASSGLPVAGAELAALVTDADTQARLLAAVAMGCAAEGCRAEALPYALDAERAAANAAPGTRAVVAQALAHAGAGAHAVRLAEQREPSGGLRPSRLGRQIEQARVAVAAGLTTHDPAAAGLLVDGQLKKVGTRSGLPTAEPLPELAELLLGLTDVERARHEPLGQAIRTACGYALTAPQLWRVETVLVQVMLRMAGLDEASEGPSTDELVDWLRRRAEAENPEALPTASLAVLHALRGKIPAALEATGSLPQGQGRAAARAAVAGQLAGVPVHLAAVHATSAHHRTTWRTRALAMAVVPNFQPAPAEARLVLLEMLRHPGWHHTLPVLARLAPGAVAGVRDIALVHLEPHASR